MKHSLYVLDNFIDDHQAVLEQALAKNYQSVEWKGAVYDGLTDSEFFDPTDQISQVMGFPVEIETSFFRCAMAGQRPAAIHSDVCESYWAAVWYLSDPEEELSGTAFWTHLETGWDRMPPLQYLENGLRNGEELLEFRKRLAQDGYEEWRWSLDTIIGMRYNRFIIYPTDYFHSRYPRTSEAKTVDTGRLTWSGFFKKKGDESPVEA